MTTLSCTINQKLFRSRNFALLLFGQHAQLSTQKITKNLTLISNESIAKGPKQEETLKPLTLIPAWLLAKPKHIQKYADIYLNRGSDVLSITITPMQLMWPTNGSQVIASQVLKFLNENYKASPLFIHGFSVGGYLWGEVLVQIAAEGDKYKAMIERFVAQVWDSAADLQDIPYGFSQAVFPNNPVMQNALMKYTMYHMKAFDKVATRHYVRSSQLFHTNMIRAPALFMTSDTDLVAPLKTNKVVTDTWESMGIDVQLKIFKDSPHVLHMQKYTKDYLDTLNSFLDKAVSSHDIYAKDKLHANCRF